MAAETYIQIANDRASGHSLDRLVRCWRSEAEKSRNHANNWESGNNWKGKRDDWMAEVCRMRAATLEACANHLEEAANAELTDGGHH